MNKTNKITEKTIEIGGSQIKLEIGRFAEQTNAAVLGRLGDTMILATVVSGGGREDLNYFPLFVEYQEKLYAGGRIKGSRWVKREGRPSEEAILNARLVDRSIRPLFPKDYKSETQVALTVLSVDAENDPDILGIITAAAALAISDIPWEGPIGAVRVGFIPKHKNNSKDNSPEKNVTTKNGDFMINPTYKEREYSDLDLVVSGTDKAVLMVEAGANEISEASILEAFKIAQIEIEKIIKTINQLAKELGAKKVNLNSKPTNQKLVNLVKKQTEELLKSLDKPVKDKPVDFDQKAIAEAISAKEPELNKAEIQDEVF